MLRFHMMLGTDEPAFLTLGDMPPDPQRWGIGGRIGRPSIPLDWPRTDSIADTTPSWRSARSAHAEKSP